MPMSSRKVCNFHCLTLRLPLIVTGAVIAAWRCGGMDYSLETIGAIVKGRQLLVDAPGWWLNILLAFFNKIFGASGTVILAALVGAVCGAGLARLFELSIQTKKAEQCVDWIALAFGTLLLVCVPEGQWVRGVGPVFTLFCWAIALTLPVIRSPGKTAFSVVLVVVFSCALNNTGLIGLPATACFLVLLQALAIRDTDWCFAKITRSDLTRAAIYFVCGLCGVAINPAGFDGVCRSFGLQETATPAFGSRAGLVWAASLLGAGLTILSVWLYGGRAHRDTRILYTVVVLAACLLTFAAPSFLVVSLATALAILRSTFRPCSGNSTLALPWWIPGFTVFVLAVPVFFLVRLEEAAKVENTSAAPFLPREEALELMRRGQGRLYCSVGTEPFLKFELQRKNREVFAIPSTALLETPEHWKNFVQSSRPTMLFVNPASEQGRLSSLLLLDESWFVAHIDHAGVLFATGESGLEPAQRWLLADRELHPIEIALNAWYVGRKTEAMEVIKRLSEEGGRHALRAKQALAQIAVETKNWSDAVEFTRRVLEDRPWDVRALYINSLGLLESGELRAAYKTLDRLLKAAPNDLSCLILAARTARYAKDHQYEIEHLARASRIARQSALSHGIYDALRAQALVRLGKPRPALEAYRAALRDGALSQKTRKEIERNIQALQRGMAAQATGADVLP